MPTILTPFRYPGAKNKLLPILMEHLDPLLKDSNNFCDAFVGGGSVALEVAVRYPKINLYLNDKDYWIYCFWSIVAGEDDSKLRELLVLLDNRPTLDLFYKLRIENPLNDIECAYRAIFFNRTTFSGILNSGPIGGKEQKSKWKVDCRYNATKLKHKITKINLLLRGRTIVDNLDINDYLIDKDMPIYCDPPYVKAGKDLYKEYMSEEDHKKLGAILLNKKKWVLSYDDSDLIRKIYINCYIYNTNGKYCINGTKTKWSKKNELIIIPKH
jgi:DNA adenine methylase